MRDWIHHISDVISSLWIWSDLEFVEIFRNVLSVLELFTFIFFQTQNRWWAKIDDSHQLLSCLSWRMAAADPHLAHVDPVDGRLPAQLLNKLPLLLELLQFSLVGKHLVCNGGCVGVTLGDSLNVTFVMCVVSSMSDGGGVDARLVGWKLMKKRVLREKWRAGPWRHAACLPPRILAGLDPCTEHRDGHRAEHLWNEEPAPVIFFLALQKRQAEIWRFFIQK